MKTLKRRGNETLAVIRPPVFVSALTGEGIDELLQRIEKAIPIDPIVKLSLHMPLSEGRTLALIHALGKSPTPVK